MHTYSVEFRIEGDELEPLQVSAALDLSPCLIRLGSELGPGKRRMRPLWSFDGNPQGSERLAWETLESGIAHLLDCLEPRRALIHENFGKYDRYWWCGHFQNAFNGGPRFSSLLLRRLADFGEPLFLETYFHE